MKILFISIVLAILICSVTADFNFNESISEDVRQPRVSGRIVKLYSGTRPEPFLCPAEGFQADPNNCAVFYRCVRAANGKFTVFRFQCGPGTIYDPETEICNYPSSTKRSECGGRNPGVGQENEIEGNPSALPIYTLKPNSEQKVTTAYPWATSKPQAQSESTFSTSNPFISNDGATRRPTSQGGDPCTTSGFMGDSENCRKFYRCVGNQRGGFIRYEFMCSENTVWDDDAQSCNHPWAVQKRSCGRGPPKEGANNSDQSTDNSFLPSNTIQKQNQLSYGNKVSQVQTQISHGLVIQNQTQINYGDLSDKKDSSDIKQNQTQISFGSAVSQTQTQINHGNKGMQTQLQVDHSQQSSQAQTVQYDEQGSGNAEKPIKNEESLPDKGSNGSECTESGFMGDQEDCKKFYRCVDNGRGGFIKYEFACGEGTVWDSSIEACNHKWAVKECGGNGSSGGESQSKPETTTQSSQITSEQTHTTETHKEDNNCTQIQSSSTSTTTETDAVTSTKNPPSPDDKCTSSGFKGDPNDCKKFYRCVDNGNGGYTRYEFSCGEGTLWDQSIEGCNHVWAVKDCNSTNGDTSQSQTETTTSSLTMSNISEQETTSSTTPAKPESSSNQPSSTDTTPGSDDICTQEGFFGDSKDCKKFYRCVDNGKGGYIKYEFTCGEGTVWDSEINSCNHESPNRKCNNEQGTATSTETGETINDEIITESPSDSSTSTQKQEVKTTPKPQSSNECSQEGFYEDKDNCRKFYRCVDNGKGGYTKYEFDCAEGTVWDQEIQTCNYESTTNCSKSTVNPTSESQTEPTDISSTTSSTSETEKTSKSPETATSSPGDVCTSEGYYANSKDCKKFYRCVDNGKGGYTKYDFTCGEGTVWVQEIQTCDHDNGVKECSSDTVNNQETSTTTEKSEQASTNASPVSSSSTPADKQDDETSDNSSKPSSSSDEKCNSEGFYANQNDCKRFYRCVNNGNGGYTKYDFECGEGTAWDNDLQTCNHEKEVKSCEQQNSGSTSKPAMQDEGVTQSSSASSSTTSGSSHSTQSSTSQSKDKCNKEGYYGNTEDCKKFYRCVDNGKGGFTKYDFDCGEGTIWDQDLTTCNHPQDVSNPSCNQSESSSTTSSTTSSTSDSSTQKTSTTTETSPGSSDCSQDNSSKKPTNVNCTKAGYYPNPDDCKKFYRCVDWDGDGKKFSVFHFECGEGTIWDPALDTCNHEDSVYPPRNCSKSQGENLNQQTTTTTTTEGTTTTESDSSTTTTEQSSEQTTQSSEQTTTEKTTTQQSTTSQQTITEKSTTEQTTSKTSTTQQTTSSEQTTAQQTTSERTTSQPTTVEQTTAQQTTSEHTTSQPTTMEQTTTEQNTTEESTTEQTTSEHTTSQQTTMQQTTQDSSSQETTTQSSSTDSTTDKNDQQTTTEQTTEGTTKESNTEQPTTSETNEITTEGTTTSSTNESSTTESSSASEKECPETDDDQYLFVCPSSFKRHPKYCNLFYQCDENDDNHDVKIAVFHCPNNTIYDENQTKCVEESKASKKCNGQIAQKRRFKRLDTAHKEPIIVSTKSLKCPTTGYFPFENEECSSGFLKCQTAKSGKLHGLIYRCPESHVYWSISKRCEPESKMRFCKQSLNTWNGRWEIPVERRNVAP